MSKQTNLVYLQFLINYALFSKNWSQKLLKKEPNVKAQPENFKINLFYFQESLCRRYNIILKLLPQFHICF